MNWKPYLIFAIIYWICLWISNWITENLKLSEWGIVGLILMYLIPPVLILYVWKKFSKEAS